MKTKRKPLFERKPLDMSPIPKQAHTPGPWHRSGGMIDGYEMIGPNGEKIISQTDTYNGLHHEANAHLIAAAPELLEALKFMVDAEYDLDIESRNISEPTLERYSKLIAKAEGR